MHRRYAILLAAVALSGAMLPASAQVVRRLAISRATAAASIEQPATIASSQDLMFVISTSTMSLKTSLSSSLSTTPTSGSTSTATDARTSNGGPTRLASLAPVGGAGLPVPARASFVLAGDSGQSISVTVPEAVDLRRAGGVETARLVTDSSVTGEPQFLAGPYASGGTLSFDVGGQVTLANAAAAAGTYNGVLAVVAQYN